jgi:hypothetical protein
LKKKIEAKKTAGGNFMRTSDQPYSKWQAIFNLEQIKERNKPTLPKKDLPKSPFFLFDLDKATNLESSNFAPNNLLKATLFTEDKPKSKHPL